MKTSPECIPCFKRQIRYAARLATTDPVSEKRVVDSVTPLLLAMDMEISPPENAVTLYRHIAEFSGCNDPFATIKKESTAMAMAMREDLGRLVMMADDPLRLALSLAIAGNIIDYGSQQDFDLAQVVSLCLDKGLAHDCYVSLVADLEKIPVDGYILYLADNCGELVFDGLVVELLAGMGKRIVLALKEGPIINDALVADARECGLDRYCTVISNGTSCPGTPVGSSSPEFRAFFSAADLIISKGQGNFETLSLVSGPIYFLLTVKCPVVAAHLDSCVSQGQSGFKCGDTVLVRNRGW